jgi:lysophospholipase L1-like esterase
MWSSRIALVLSISVGLVVVVTSAWTINEVGKSNRAILAALNARAETLNARIDRLSRGTVRHEHSDVRQFMIAAHLARADRPIIFLGDSITEAAVLPDAICGHAVVNAGIGGAGVGQLQNVVPTLLDGKSPALVVLAIGTNDAYPAPGQEQGFSASYVKLLQTLAPFSPKLVVANIPSVDPKGATTLAAGIDASLIDRFNNLLPQIAEGAGASFIDLNKAVGSEGSTETIDGVHLAPRAYRLWDAAMLAGVKAALNCSIIAQ